MQLARSSTTPRNSSAAARTMLPPGWRGQASRSSSYAIRPGLGMSWSSPVPPGQRVGRPHGSPGYGYPSAVTLPAQPGPMGRARLPEVSPRVMPRWRTVTFMVDEPGDGSGWPNWLLRLRLRLVVLKRRARRSPESGAPEVNPLQATDWMAMTALVVIGVAGLIGWWLLSVADQATGPAHVTAQLDATRIALAAGGGAGASVGLLLAFRRQQHQEKATQLANLDAVERRITERYTAAIEQLGSDKPDIRIGGIYALERLANDSPGDHPTIIDVLCTFIREHTRHGSSGDMDAVLAAWMAVPAQRQHDESKQALPAADVQAALTVVGRRRAAYDVRPIDLTSANLSGANLVGANLSEAILTDAFLVRGNLTNSNLTNADLASAHLRSVHLSGANLSGANLIGADMTGANLVRTNLSDAFMVGTYLMGAYLTSANLTDANLTDADLRGIVYRRSMTRWPEGFTPPPSAYDGSP